MKYPAKKLSTAIICCFAVSAGCSSISIADVMDQFPETRRVIPTSALQRSQTLQPLQRTVQLEDMLHSVDYPVKYLQAVPLRDLRIPGLDKNALDLLGFNYFVVVDNTPYPDMSSVYRVNRLRGKSNFVTVDSITHPYFAFSNRVLATAIEQHLIPELSGLLKAMLVATLNDYGQVEDSGVRQDIEHNIAYLSVALKLTDPEFELPERGDSAQLAQADLKSIENGAVATSKIFEYDEDFSNYVPLGWYNSSPALQNFYRLQQWISHMGYPLTEGGAEAGKSGNNFRRSILLYRSLQYATVKGTPAFDVWKKIYQAWLVFGSFEGYQGNKVLLPVQYQVALKDLPADLKVSLSALAEPLYRAKLLLAIKKQTQSGLQSSSIFELQGKGRAKNPVAAFALFPPSGDPEWPWMKAIAKFYVDQDQAAQTVPISLSCLQAHGAPQANNVMLARLAKLDPVMVQLLPELDRLVNPDTSSSNKGPLYDRRWQILENYFRFPNEGAQGALRTDTWMSRRLESAFAAWVDSHMTIAPSVTEAQMPETQQTQNQKLQNQKPQATAAGASQATASGTDSTPAGGKLFSSYTQEALNLTKNNSRKQMYFHYLEPSPESFLAIAQDAQKLSRQLGQLGYLSPADAGRFLEFIKLSQRLQRIAVCELKDEVLPIGDLKLLGNIDKIMDRVDVPLPGVLYLSGKKSGGNQLHAGGVNLALGHPAQLYVILQLGDKVWLARGAMYSYYEIGGVEITPQHWERKLHYSLLRQPFWADKFDAIVQEDTSTASTPNRAPAPPRSPRAVSPVSRIPLPRFIEPTPQF